MTLFTFAGLAATMAGCTCIYLSSANQRWLAEPWPPRAARGAATGLLVLGWLCLARNAQGTAASFIFLTTAMLSLAVLPYLGALLHGRRIQ